MTVEYSIDRKRRLVITTLSGELSVAECFAHHLTLAMDPEFDPSYNELIDGGEIDNVQLDSTSIFKLGQSCPYSGAAYRAIYTADRPINYACAYLFQLFASGRHGVIKVFKDRSDAIRWLEDIEAGCIDQEQ